MLVVKKHFVMRRRDLRNKFRVENNNLDISAIVEGTGFQVVKLGDVAPAHRIDRNRRQTREQVFKYIQISDIDVDLGRIKSFRRFSGVKAPNNARRIMRQGDVLVSTRRPTRGAIVAVPAEFDQDICTVFFTSLRVKDTNVIDPRYLALFLRTSLARYQFQAMITETAYPVIADADVENLTLFYPGIAEQRRLADDYDAAVLRFFDTTNAAYAGITQARQAVENMILGEHAEALVAKVVGLRPEEIIDENGDEAGDNGEEPVDNAAVEQPLPAPAGTLEQLFEP
jgi:restriction endonuclease S subunit